MSPTRALACLLNLMPIVKHYAWMDVVTGRATALWATPMGRFHRCSQHKCFRFAEYWIYYCDYSCASHRTHHYSTETRCRVVCGCDMGLCQYMESRSEAVPRLGMSDPIRPSLSFGPTNQCRAAACGSCVYRAPSHRPCCFLAMADIRAQKRRRRPDPTST